MNFEYGYRHVKISVITGDITKLKVDAIVNPANSMCSWAVALRVQSKRWEEKKLKTKPSSMLPVSVGKAIATNAGKLKAKYVIHAPTMEKPAMQTTVDNVRLTMEGALNCAERLGIKSIAFPGMGTGVGGLSLEEASKIMVEQIKSHIDLRTSLKEIVLVDFRMNWLLRSRVRLTKSWLNVKRHVFLFKWKLLNKS
jgi:O-acetyl-ADP-ribose deacetylase (regulator of RNase III)